MTTEMVPETSVIFNQMKWLIAREDFITPEVITAVNVSLRVFWDVTQYSLTDKYQLSEELQLPRP
jgi:hypothetical protein